MNSISPLVSELAQLVTLIAQAQGHQSPQYAGIIHQVESTAQRIVDTVAKIEADGEVSQKEIDTIQQQRHAAVQRWHEVAGR